jgi:aspartyl aminopeptidase
MAKKSDLLFESRSCWETYAGKTHAAAMDDAARRYLDFLSACKTERETVVWVRERLQEAGFSEDFGQTAVFRDMRGKTMFIARKGRRSLAEGFRLVGAHADTPRLDLKQRPLTEEAGIGQAKTHYYGGIRKHQWLARPLALHGVVVRTDGGTVPVVLGEDPSEPVFTVPDLLPHLAYGQQDKKLAKAFEAEKLNVVVGHAPALDSKKKKVKNGAVKQRVLELLHAKYSIAEEDLYSAELQAVPAGPARFVGLDGSLLGGYGQDDRICVFAALEALLAAPAPEHAQVVLCWDKEEIGSDGSTGAKSMFFEYCLEELARAWAPNARMPEIMLASKALSADVHAAVDPDYQDLHEKLNAAYMGHGPCFCKFTGHRGKYGANDAHAEYVAWLRRLMNDAGVPWQMAELGKVDLGGGGTVAKFLAVYGMDIIDFGPPILSMHSPFELCSTVDLYATIKAYHAFLSS